ncbi:alternative ribosome rescue aminoacyl-tRNA hydrolase ArfB [Microlunatus flavus]|uniref:Ribosome-associated protein n=1 Tax=Microlunatus flavus TaxID=1036181 RepID=A0A1H9FDX4_9ACTN|nr:alternative ribosome rescue aminoacyl-tRNA hydrolase ArfB [Microlunatus flavus]SEQ36055.1 ribosome-associated protein [Microlunatus flavus]
MPDDRSAYGPLRVSAALVLGADELRWRFSRSSGPGGQGVNTADSRVELTWEPASSPGVLALPEAQRERLLARLGPTLVNGAVVIAASEHRAQLRNREEARTRLADRLRTALAPPPRSRRATRPTRGSVERRLSAKAVRASVKASRRRRFDEH